MQMLVASVYDYFQITAAIAFLLILVGRALHMLLNRKINPIVIGGGKKGFRRAVELISFSGLAVWLVETFLYALHSEVRLFPWPLDSQLIDAEPARIAGVVLITLGLTIFVCAFVSFGDSWRVGFDVKTPGALVTTGIFAFTRNPIYVFLDLWFLGTFLINGRLIFLIFALLAFAVIHWQILQEETFLRNLYGQDYQDYLHKTGRYVTLPR